MTGKISTNTLRHAITLALLCIYWPSAAVVGARPAQLPGNATDIRLLYESADYEGALALATRLDATTLRPEDVREIQLYEALCELALGNQARAEGKLETILQAHPLYQPPDGMPNRIRLLTEKVRSRLAPALAQARYRTGKAHFDAKNCKAAATEFALVLDLVPDGAGETPQQLDVRTLASGFLALCNETPAPRPAATMPPNPTPALASDPGVVPPIAVHRDIPAWPVQFRAFRRPGDVTFSGILEVSVNKNGRVEAARIIQRIHPLYDGLLLAATKNWVFEPATKNHEPVDYVLQLKVDVQ